MGRGGGGSGGMSHSASAPNAIAASPIKSRRQQEPRFRQGHTPYSGGSPKGGRRRGSPKAKKPEWVGSPSSYKQFSFSATANYHIKNEQDIVDELAPKSMTAEERRRSPKRFEANHATFHERKPKGRAARREKPDDRDPFDARREDGWRIASSNKKLTFSSTANKNIHNAQEVPSYTAPTNWTFIKQKGGGRGRRKRSPSRRQTAAAKAKKEAAAREAKAMAGREKGWAVESSTAALSFSSSANKHIKNKQDIPDVKPYPFTVRDRYNWEPEPIPVLDRAAIGLRKKGEEEGAEPFKPLTKAQRAAREAEWAGSPSSFGDLTFSSTANRHIKNLQDIPGSHSYDDRHTAPRQPPPKLDRHAEEQKILSPRQLREQQFVGSPSSYAKISWSSSANKHIHNHQDIPPVKPLYLPPPERDDKPEEVDLREQKFHARREQNWKGSPSTYKKLTFSSTANRFIVNEQEFFQDEP